MTVTTDVSAIIPVHLLSGVTLADATSAMDLALLSYLASRNPSQAITVDGLLAAIRDDTRFAVVRAEVMVTVESGTSFAQLTDGVGTHLPAMNETVRKGVLDVQPREAI